MRYGKTMKKVLSMALKSLQFNRILAALFLAVVMTVGSMLPLFAAGQAQASIGYSVFGWGENNFFQLATGQGADQTHPLGTRYLPTGLPNLTAIHNVNIDSGRGIERLYSGLQHNIAIMVDGSVFAWGRGAEGQTGHQGVAPAGNLPRPTEIPTLTNLNRVHGIEVIHTGQHHNIAILRNGQVWAWGTNTRGQLGLGTSTNVMIPTLNPLLTHISQEYGIAMFRNGSNFNHILTRDGRVFGWGHANDGRLGMGSYTHLNTVYLGSPPVRHYFLETPTEITQLTALAANPGIAQWHTGGHHSIIILGDDSARGWGVNSSLRAGFGTGGAPVLVPTNAGPLTNISQDPNRGIARMYVGYDMNMLITRPNAAGEVTAYLWGTNYWGALGNGTVMGTQGPSHPAGPTSVPAVSAIFNNYDTVVRAHKNQHTANWLFIAYCETDSEYTAYGWGAANYGRTGLDGGGPNGSGLYRISFPVELPLVSDLANQGAQFFLGGRFTFAFDPAEPPAVGIRKVLQMAEGATPPDSVTFRFQFTPRGDVVINPYTNSRPLNAIPALLPNATPPGSVPITLHGINATTANTVTVVGNFNLMDIFGTIVFSSGGIYVWEVEEIRTAPHNSGTTFPSFMEYDTSRFQVRVHANSAGVATAIEVFEMNYASGSWTVGEKVRNLDFLNTYRKLAGPNTPHNGLEIVKRVSGIHANLSTPFTFTLNLTEHFLAPLSFPITAHILAADGVTQTPRNIYSASQAGIVLRHNERLIIPAIYAGTTFTVTETGVANFTPSYRITTGNVQDTNYTTGTVGNNLTTRNYNNIVWDTGRNAADFTNIHSHTPPVGLFITSAPWIVAVVFAVLAVTLMVTARNRKRIEELPLVI